MCHTSRYANPIAHFLQVAQGHIYTCDSVTFLLPDTISFIFCGYDNKIKFPCQAERLVSEQIVAYVRTCQYFCRTGPVLLNINARLYILDNEFRQMGIYVEKYDN